MIVDWAARPATPLLALAAITLCWLLPAALRLSGFPLHPATLAGAAAAWFERKLNRARRSEPDRAVRGALVVLLLVGLAAVAGWAMEVELVAAVRYGWIAELALLVLALDPRGVIGRVRGAAGALNRGDPADRAAARLARRGEPLLDQPDGHGVARLAVEHAARGANEAFVAPLFWYLVLGLPAMLAAQVIMAAARQLAGGAPSRRAFGIVAGGLDTAMATIPAWITALALCIGAAFVPGARPGAAAAALAKGGGGPAGAPVAAMAGALGLGLGGPRRMRQGDERWRDEHGWIGEGRARATPADARRAIWFMPLLTLFVVAGLAAALPIAAGG